MPRIDHVAIETPEPDDVAAFYERVFRARVVKTEGDPVMAYVGPSGFAFHAPGGPGEHTAVRVGGRADPAPPRRRRNPVRGARPRDRDRSLLPRSRRTPARSDHQPRWRRRSAARLSDRR